MSNSSVIVTELLRLLMLNSLNGGTVAELNWARSSLANYEKLF